MTCFLGGFLRIFRGWGMGFFGIIYSLLKNSLVTERVRKKNSGISQKSSGGLVEKVRSSSKKFELFFSILWYKLDGNSHLRPYLFEATYLRQSYSAKNFLNLKNKRQNIINRGNNRSITKYCIHQKWEGFKSGELVFAANWSYFLKFTF